MPVVLLGSSCVIRRTYSMARMMMMMMATWCLVEVVAIEDTEIFRSSIEDQSSNASWSQVVLFTIQVEVTEDHVHTGPVKAVH